MKKTELKKKLVSVVLIALILGSIFASAVSAESVSDDFCESSILHETERYGESDTSNSSDNCSLGSEIDCFLDANKPVFVFFYADWCHFCQQQKPVIDELEQEYDNEIAFIRVDAEGDSQALEEFDVRGYPTMFLIVGKEDEDYRYKRFGGYKEKDVLAEELDRVIETGTVDDVHVMSFNDEQKTESDSFSGNNHYDFDLPIRQVDSTYEGFSDANGQIVDVVKGNKTKKFGVLQLSQIVNAQQDSKVGAMVQKSFYGDIEGIIIRIPSDDDNLMVKSFGAFKTSFESNESQEAQYIKWRASNYAQLIKSASDESKRNNPDLRVSVFADDIYRLTDGLDLYSVADNGTVKPTEDFHYVFQLRSEIASELDYVIIEDSGICVAVPAIVVVAGLILLSIFVGYIAEAIYEAITWCMCEQWGTCICNEDENCGAFVNFAASSAVTIITAPIGGLVSSLKTALVKAAPIIFGSYISYSLGDLHTEDDLETITTQAASVEKEYPGFLDALDHTLAHSCVATFIVNPLCVHFNLYWHICMKPVITEKMEDKTSKVFGDYTDYLQESIPKLDITWEIDEKELNVDETTKVTYSITAHDKWGPAYNVHIEDSIPPEFDVTGATAHTFDLIAPGETKTLSYTIKATKEGAYTIHRHDVSYWIRLTYEGEEASDKITLGGSDIYLTVLPTECVNSQECPPCHSCDGNTCKIDDNDPNEKCGNGCCENGRCYINGVCSPDGDKKCVSGTWSAIECGDEICECGETSLNCPEDCGADPSQCPKTAFMRDDHSENEYLCQLCTEDDIGKGYCEKVKLSSEIDGCYYGDPDDTRHNLCEIFSDGGGGDDGGASSCDEHKLPDDHGYISCEYAGYRCNCEDVCDGNLRLYQPLAACIEGQTCYEFNDCLYQHCKNCGVDACAGGKCVEVPTDAVCDEAQCLPNYAPRYDTWSEPSPSLECSPIKDTAHYTEDYIKRCEKDDASFHYSSIYKSESPSKINDWLWNPKLSSDKEEWLDGIKCTNWTSDEGCKECRDEKKDMYEVRAECYSPIPSNFLLCGDSSNRICYDPNIYECCGGDDLVEKDQDNDGIPDHKCCIDRVKRRGCDGNMPNTQMYIPIYKEKDIMFDESNCGGCGLNCTREDNGACWEVGTDLDHICSGSTPQCCNGNCSEPKPELMIESIEFFPETLIEDASATVVVTIDRIDEFDSSDITTDNVEVELFIDGTLEGTNNLFIRPDSKRITMFSWNANISVGAHELKVVIDPNDKIDDCNKKNNELVDIITVHPKPDLTLVFMKLYVDGSPIDETYDITSGEKISANATLHNIGETDANRFIMSLSVDGEPHGYQIISIPGGESKELSFNWTAILGEHNLAITADSLPVPDGIIPETNELNNEVSKTVNVLIKGETAPLLSYTFEHGYFFDGVELDIGNESTIFEYRIEYVDYDDDPPASGHPKLWLDMNGDSDYDDVIGGFAEGSFAMNEANVSDIIYSDGKLYSYATSLPCGAAHTYKFSANDVTGMTATGEVDINSGPHVECINLPPVISDAGVTPEVGDNGAIFTWSGNVTDSEGDALAVNWSLRGLGDLNENGYCDLDDTVDIINIWENDLYESLTPLEKRIVDIDCDYDCDADDANLSVEMWEHDGWLSISMVKSESIYTYSRILFDINNDSTTPDYKWKITASDGINPEVSTEVFDGPIARPPSGPTPIPSKCFTQLTTDSARDWQPSWSSDGNKIVFTSTRAHSRPDIWVMDADGSNEELLIGGSDSYENPSYRPPDDSKILFSGYIPYGSGSSIWTMNPDTSGQEQIVYGSSYDFYRPSWSPDGNKIVYHGCLRYEGSDNEIYVIDYSDRTTIRLTDNDVYDGYATWSPDGGKIAFVSDRSGESHIWIINSDGTNPIDTGISGGQPKWSPADVDKIAFTSTRSGNCDIWLLTNVQQVMAGGEQKIVQLTRDDANDCEGFAWSPDGNEIVFSSDRSRNFDIWVMDVSCASCPTPVGGYADNDFYYLASYSEDDLGIIHVYDRDTLNLHTTINLPCPRYMDSHDDLFICTYCGPDGPAFPKSGIAIYDKVNDSTLLKIIDQSGDGNYDIKTLQPMIDDDYIMVPVNAGANNPLIRVYDTTHPFNLITTIEPAHGDTTNGADDDNYVAIATAWYGYHQYVYEKGTWDLVADIVLPYNGEGIAFYEHKYLFVGYNKEGTSHSAYRKYDYSNLAGPYLKEVEVPEMRIFKMITRESCPCLLICGSKSGDTGYLLQVRNAETDEVVAEYEPAFGGWIQWLDSCPKKYLPPMTITATCPVDLTVTDPDGLTINKRSTEIPEATYIETDLNGDGDLDDRIVIPDRKKGDYQITVIPEPGAESTDTYTLEVSTVDTTIVLAENVPISDTPDQPYTIESTETGIFTPCNISLSTGWNLISAPLNLTSWELGDESVVGDPLNVTPENSLTSIYRYNTTLELFEKCTHYAGWGWAPATGSESFTELEPGRGYWVMAESDCDLTFTGTAPSDLDVPLDADWNCIGWYSTSAALLGEEAAVGDPLNVTPENSLTSIYRYNTTSELFEKCTHYAGWGWAPATGSESFTELEPGRGYWVMAKNDCVWEHEAQIK
jgi:Tol biopolymer transport system component/thiol-disulfide isomerase/thioredoxin